MQLKSVTLAALCALFLGIPVWAHHSHGNYQMTTYMNLKGTVKEIHWINPHSWIYLDVKDANGELTVWALEGASVTQLRRRGWTADSIKPGDPLSVRCHQLRDGSNGCLLGFITTPDGTEKIFD